MAGFFDDIQPNAGQPKQKTGGGFFDDIQPQAKMAEAPREETSALGRGFHRLGTAASFGKHMTAQDYEAGAANIAESARYDIEHPSSTQVKEMKSAWDEGEGIVGGIKGVAGEIKRDFQEAPTFVEGVKEVGRDIKGLGTAVVEQMPYAVAPLAGMGAGVLSTSLIPAPGARIAGAFTGASMGNALVEGQGIAREAIQEAGIDPQDQVAVSKFLRENAMDLFKKTATKGAIIGAVDTATMGASKFILTEPGKIATKKILKDLGVDVSSKSAVKEAVKGEAFKKRLLSDVAYQSSKQGVEGIARNVTAATLEPLGEYVGEYVGSGIALDNWDSKNAALEALSSIGQSGMTFAGQKAYQMLIDPKVSKQDKEDIAQSVLTGELDTGISQTPMTQQESIDAQIDVEMNELLSPVVIGADQTGEVPIDGIPFEDTSENLAGVETDLMDQFADTSISAHEQDIERVMSNPDRIAKQNSAIHNSVMNKINQPESNLSAEETAYLKTYNDAIEVAKKQQAESKKQLDRFRAVQEEKADQELRTEGYVSGEEQQAADELESRMVEEQAIFGESADKRAETLRSAEFDKQVSDTKKYLGERPTIERELTPEEQKFWESGEEAVIDDAVVAEPTVEVATDPVTVVEPDKIDAETVDDEPVTAHTEKPLSDIPPDLEGKQKNLYLAAKIEGLSDGQAANHARRMSRMDKRTPADVLFQADLQKTLKGDKETTEGVMAILNARAGSLGMSTEEYLNHRGLSITPDSTLKDESGKPLAQDNKGAVVIGEHNSTIHAFESADVTTALHELGHVFMEDLGKSDRQTVESWAGVKEGQWKTEHKEKFARAWEKYITEGVAPTDALREVFAKLKDMMLSVYGSLNHPDINVEISPEVRAVFDRMLTEDEVVVEGGTIAKDVDVLMQKKEKLTRDEILDTDRFMEVGLKIGKKAKIYRGVSDDSGTHAAKLGRGLYTTTDRKQAGKYGDVVEMSQSDIPNNPIRFNNEMAFENWFDNLFREKLGFKRISDFENVHGSVDRFIAKNVPDIDGVQIGTGHGAFFVKFPEQEEILKQQKPVDTNSENFKHWFGDSKVVDDDAKPLVVYHGTGADFDTFDFDKIGDRTGEGTGSVAGFYFSSKYVANQFTSRDGSIMPVFLRITNPYTMPANEFQEMQFGESERADNVEAIQTSLESTSGLSLYPMFDGALGYIDNDTGREVVFSEDDVEVDKREEVESMLEEYYNIVTGDSRDFEGSSIKEWTEFVEGLKSNGYDGIIVESEEYDSGEHDILQAEELYDDNYIVFNPTQIKSATSNTGEFSLTDPSILKQAKAKPYTKEEKSTVFTGAKQKWQEIAEKNDLGAKAEKLITYMVDKDAPISRVQKELPKQPEGRDYNLHRRLMGKKIADETEVFDKETLTPLLGYMSKSKLSIKDVEDLAYAEHVPERNLQMKRINARRYIDAVLKEMGDGTKPWKDKIAVIKSKHNSPTNKNRRRDAYVSLMDDLANGHSESEFAQTWNDVKDRLAGATNDEAEKVIADWKTKSNYAENKIAVDRLRKIGSDALEMSYKAGEIADEEYDAMKQAYTKHVPLYREERESSKSYSLTKVAAGSTRKVVDIFAHVVDNYQGTISRKHKLEASKVLYDMVKANPDDSMWSLEEQEKVPRLDSEGNIRLYPDLKEPDNGKFIRVAGKKYLVSVPYDNKSMRRFMDAIKDTPAPLGPVLKASQKVNRFLAQLNTSFSPEFMVTNFTRDIQTAGIHMEDTEAKGMQKKVFKDIKPAISSIYKSEMGKDAGEWGDVYKDFKKNGGKISWMQGYENVDELAKQIETDLQYISGKRPKREKFKKLIEFVSATNTAVENGVRLSTYKHLIDSGTSKRKAAHIVSNLTVDFTRHGSAGPMINSLWMFANAGIQGNARMIKAVSKNKKVQKIVGGIMAFGFASNIMGAMIGGDDEDGEAFYDKMKRTTPSLFERNMVFMLPWGEKGEHFKIPMPYGYGLFYVAGNEAASALRSPEGYSNTEGMARVMSTFLNTFNPIGAGTVLQTLSPTVTDPIVQSMENKSWSGSDLMPGDSPYGVQKPDSERYWKSVNPAAKWITEKINKITGGSAAKPGVLDISPETVENMVENYTGSLGRFIKDTLSIPLKLGGDGVGIRDIPFARKLFGGASEYADSKIYRENRDKIEIYSREISAGLTDRSNLQSMVRTTKDTEKRLRRMRKRLIAAEDSGNKDRAKAIKDLILAEQRRYNKRFNANVY